MRDRAATIFLITLLAVMTCLPLLHSWYTTTDDVYLALGLQQGKRITGLGDAVHSGRLQHVLTGNLVTLAYGWGSYWLMKPMAIAAILGSVAAMFVAVRLLAGSTRFAALAVVFFFAFVQNTHDHNLLTAYPVLPTTALTAFWLAVAAWWLALQGRSRYGPVSVALFVISLLVYENFLVYACIFPLLTVVAKGGTWPERARRALLTPHVAATLVVLVLIVGFRVVFQTDTGRDMMATEQYVINLDPYRILKVIERYGASAFPLHYSRVNRPLVSDFYMGFGTFNVTLGDIFRVVEPAWLIKALIVAYLTAVFVAGRDQLVQRRGVLLFVALVLIVLTNLPLALTAKYQTWAIESFSHGYLTSYFVFFGVVILLALLLEGLVAWLSGRSRMAARVVAGTVALASFATCYATDLFNAHVAHTERRMYDKWQLVDQWIASDAFRAVPPDSFILAPALFEHYPGTVHVFDDYWTMYASQHGGRSVEVLRERSDWVTRSGKAAAAGRMFFLDLEQDRRGDSSHLVFGRVTGALEGRPMVSDELAILSRARADHFRIVGRLFGANPTCRTRVYVNGVPTDGTFTDRFGAHVDIARGAREWLWTRLSIKGASFDPDSILVSESEVAVDGAVDVLFGRGFQLDEIAYRWAESEATLTLRNRTDRTLRSAVEFTASAPGVAPGASARLEVTSGSWRAEWSIGREYEKRSFAMEIPPTSTVDVRFRTDAPRMVAPLDSRVLVMRFQPEIRVREAGCEGT